MKITPALKLTLTLIAKAKNIDPAEVLLNTELALMLLSELYDVEALKALIRDRPRA